jgi:type I restriction enzyme S subunit
MTELKNVADIFDGTHQTPEYKDSGIPFVSVENIEDIYNYNKFISIDAYTKEFSKNHPEQNDILMTRIGDIGTPAFVTRSENMGYYVSLALLKPKNINNKYLYYYIQTSYFQHELWKKTIHVAFPKKINKEDIGDCKIFLPNLIYQDQIVELFDKLEARIIAQKKIINNLESLINTIKNKIFNNEVCISKTPLKDILIEINRKSTVNNQFPVISSTVKGLVLQSEYFDKEIASENNIGYKIISKDNIIISPQNLWMGNITYNDKFENGIVSPSYKIFNISEKYNGKYIFEMLTTKKAFYYYKTVSEQGASVVRRNLNYEAFMELMFNVPPKETQDHDIKILESYNDKLTNEKKILLAYEKQKQYLLNHMFI